jgi:regulator of replication initiation timing
LRRYFLCRSLFNQEEQKIRAEIDDFQSHLQVMLTKNAVLSQARKHLSILSNASSMEQLPTPDFKQDSDQLHQVRSLEYQNRILYDKQEEFNARFSSFTREVSEFTLLPYEAIAKKYGEEIASIWQGFEIDEPYSMCMAFLSLLDGNSDLPWCYFPSVVLQSCYVSMLPWTRTRYIPNCDDIWEHYDSEAEAIVPGPSTQPLSKKIKVPDGDDWYRLQYHDTAKNNAEQTDLFNLSQILYEVTGCIMPRKPERHLAALNTLNRYGINNKKANQNLLYCMALLGEAKHQSQFNQIPVSQEPVSEELPDTVDELKAQVIALREELSQCRQALQDEANKNSAGANQKALLQHQLTHRDYLIHDLSTVVFNSKLPTNPNAGNFPYRTASNYVVFSTDEAWLKNMHEKLPDIQFFPKLTKANCKTIRSTDTIWIQPKDMSFDEYRCILAEARKSDIPVRIFPFDDANSCASLMVHADISR